MAVLELRVCDRHLPERVLAEGKKWPAQIGDIRLEYDLCKECRAEMDAVAQEAAKIISRGRKSVATRKTKGRKKVAAARKSTARAGIQIKDHPDIKITKRGSKYPCRYDGCTEGPFRSGQQRGQHERFAHGGAAGRPKKTVRKAKAKTKVARTRARNAGRRKRVAAALAR